MNNYPDWDLCNHCKHLDGDESGVACGKQPEGLSFQPRKRKCKYFELKELKQ